MRLFAVVYHVYNAWRLVARRSPSARGRRRGYPRRPGPARGVQRAFVTADPDLVDEFSPGDQQRVRAFSQGFRLVWGVEGPRGLPRAPVVRLDNGGVNDVEERAVARGGGPRSTRLPAGLEAILHRKGARWRARPAVGTQRGREQRGAGRGDGPRWWDALVGRRPLLATSGRRIRQRCPALHPCGSPKPHRSWAACRVVTSVTLAAAGLSPPPLATTTTSSEFLTEPIPSRPPLTRVSAPMT